MLFLRRPRGVLSSISYLRQNKQRCYCDSAKRASLSNKIKSGPGLKEFVNGNTVPIPIDRPDIPYLPEIAHNGEKLKVFFDVFGCQMNVNDIEIVWSILKNEGFEKTQVEEDADIFLVMTCAIREGAESKIWHRLDHLRGFKRRRASNKLKGPVKIGILGCMAERLKEKLIEKEKAVDIVAGPDSYRDLPRLLSVSSGQTAVNVMLSLDETYADVTPVRLNPNNVSAFISIMRGCDNMCTYCIVPFTRGRERSRALSSVLDEVRHLCDQGVREITLLGQNVNSYRDLSEQTKKADTHMAKGFKTVYKNKVGGVRFVDLLDKVSLEAQHVRIRFTAAHPKDFPDQVLQLIADRSNICKLLHLPAQSGSSRVLERMRRGYSREVYLQLVDLVRAKIPGVGLSTDMICGFCGETEEDFEETLSLMETVGYHMAYLFPYSMRQKTTAHRRYKDDVPDHVKKDRHNRMVQLYRKSTQIINQNQIGQTQLILVEGFNIKYGLVGRNEYYLKVYFEQSDISTQDGGRAQIKAGDFVAVKIVSAKSSSLSGVALNHTSISEFYN